MDDQLSNRAASLQDAAFIIDAHFDLTYEVANLRERGQSEVVRNNYLDQLRAGGIDMIVSAIFIDDVFLPEMGLRKALDQISWLHTEIEETPGLFRICRNLNEVKGAKEAGEVAIMLSLEGADPLQNDIRLLRIFFELGVRGLGLVWSRRNYAADGAFFADRREGRKGGLTPFGVSLIEEAEKLGMFIDVSHLNDEGFWDVLEVANQPILASHSNCRALKGAMRNLSDEQIKGVGKNGGVIGINSVNVYLNEDGDKSSVADMVRHIDHIVQLIGIDHVGLGFDLCDSFKDHLTMGEAIETNDVLDSHAELPLLIEKLLMAGYTDEHVAAILGKNFLRFYEKTLG